MEIKPVYSKVNLRRAMASEKLERFEDALEGRSFTQSRRCPPPALISTFVRSVEYR